MIRYRARCAHQLAAGTALVLVLSAGAAQAQNTEVGELVVTARLEESLPIKLAEFGNRLEVIDNKKLQSGGFNEVAEALARTAPGLYVASRAGPFSYVEASLQGSRDSEILYLIDGVRISNRLYNTTPPLDTVPAHIVDRIEILEGGQGLFYGTQAVAGVINTVTKPFTDDWQGQLTVGVHTNEGWHASGYASGAIGKHKLVVFASHDQADGYQPFFDRDYQPSATDRERSYDMTSLGVKYAYDVSDAVRLSASYQHNQGEVDSILPFFIKSASNARNEEIATVKLDWTPSDKLALFLKGYWHDWDTLYNEVDNGPTGPEVISVDEFWGFWDYGVNSVAKLTPQPGLELFAGYDLQKYWGKDEVLLIADQTETTHAVFGQVRITPELLPRTHLAAGVRHNMPGGGESATVFNVSGRFDVTDGLFVRATGGTAFRLPDAYELFVDDPSAGEHGNPSLEPERARTLNASVGGTVPLAGGSARWEAIAFWRRTKGLIDYVDSVTVPGFLTFANTDAAVTAKGFELVVAADVTQDLSLNGSFAHASTQAAGSDLQFARIPRNLAKAGVDFHPADSPFGGSVFANWVGPVYAALPSGLGRVNYGNYLVVDVNAYVEFGPERQHRVSLRLENAFNEAYSAVVRRGFTDATGDAYAFGLRGVPRTLHVKYSYSFR